jgi:hypothetical protein
MEAKSVVHLKREELAEWVQRAKARSVSNAIQQIQSKTKKVS